jgi:hypothetical protein
VRTSRQQLQQVFGADNREQKGFRIPINRGKKYMTARSDQLGAGQYNQRWIRDVFEHFEARNYIVLARLFCSQFFCRRLAVIDGDLRFNLMQPGYREGPLGHIDSGYRCAGAGHGLGKDAAAAADINNILALQIDVLTNPVKPQRIDFMESSKFAMWIPPT